MLVPRAIRDKLKRPGGFRLGICDRFARFNLWYRHNLVIIALLGFIRLRVWSQRERFRLASSRLPLFLFFLFVGFSWAQQDIPSFRVESNVILVDLIVTDKEGNFVSDLRPEELEVYEDRKKQRVVFFQLHESKFHKEEPGSKPVLASAPVDTSHHAPRSRGAPVVFLVDLNNMHPHTLNQIRESIRAYMNGDAERPGKFMLASVKHQLSVDQRFTRDPSKFLAALDDLRAAPDIATDFPRLLQEMETIFLPLDFLDPPISLVRSVVSSAVARGRIYLNRINQKLATTRGAVVAVLRHLGSLPGRKTVFFYSNGYPLAADMILQNVLARRLQRMDLPPEQQMVYIQEALGEMSKRMGISDHLRVMANEANLSQISIYSIDPRGLMTTGLDASLAGGSNNFNGKYASAGIKEPQRFLKILSKNTGGLCFVNSNDLEAGLRQAFRDSGRYYLLGYVPTTKRKKGKFHQIKIKVRRRGVEVRFRDGYSEREDSRAVRDQMVNAFKFPELFEDFPLTVGTGYRSGKLIVRTVIPTPSLDFQATDENRNQCTVEIMGALLDESGKWISDRFVIRKQFDMDFSDQELQDWKRHRVVVNISETELSPGEYDLVVVARQAQSGKISAVLHNVQVGTAFEASEN